MKKMVAIALLMMSASTVNAGENVKYKSCSFMNVDKNGTIMLVLEIKGAQNPDKQLYEFLCREMPNTEFIMRDPSKTVAGVVSVTANNCDFDVKTHIVGNRYVVESKSINACIGNSSNTRGYTIYKDGTNFSGACGSGDSFAGTYSSSNNNYTVSGPRGTDWAWSKSEAIKKACGE